MFHYLLCQHPAFNFTRMILLFLLVLTMGIPSWGQTFDGSMARLLVNSSTMVMPQDDALIQERQDFLKNFKRIGMNTTFDDATLLRILIESSEATRGVEIGSANGYGAIHMGMGFERTGGTLTTIDINPDMVRQCRTNIEKTHLQDTVSCVEGDALKVLKELEGPFDFAFIDAAKEQYLAYFRLLEPKLEPGSLIVADNVIQFANQMNDFLEEMRTSDNYEMVIVRASLEKEDGLAIIYKRK
ncbi:MAG TPA: class I SAM-dependent methyltransferase [Acidobacteriota bacterium]|nr:class I SAM-dependent methyltransferase [Acidobacteriota bacterium]